jgi:hypothetical protein
MKDSYKDSLYPADVSEKVRKHANGRIRNLIGDHPLEAAEFA